MAKAYVSFHPVVLKEPFASSTIGPAVYSDVLDFTSGADTSGALTQARASLTLLKDVTQFVVIATLDTAAFLATGTTPDCDATAQTSASSARVYWPAGLPYEQTINIGEAFAAKAVA